MERPLYHQPDVTQTPRQLAQTARFETEQQILGRPELAQYVNEGTLRRAGNALQQLGNLLKTEPMIAQVMAEYLASAAEPGTVPYLISTDPEMPLVITQTHEGLEGFAPILGCTLNAIDAVLTSYEQRHGSHHEQQFILVKSDRELLGPASEQVDTDTSDVVWYAPGMDALAYVRLAEERFGNETHRFSIRNSKLQKLKR